MGEHKHGKMDIADQEKTFAGFVSLTTKAVIVIAVFLILLALIGA